MFFLICLDARALFSLQPGVLGSLQDVFPLLFISNWMSLPWLSTDAGERMQPANGLHMATAAKNMTMFWDPLPSEFTIRSDDIYDQSHYDNKADRMKSHVGYRSTVFPVTLSLASNSALCPRTVESYGKPSSMWSVTEYSGCTATCRQHFGLLMPPFSFCSSSFSFFSPFPSPSSYFLPIVLFRQFCHHAPRSPVEGCLLMFSEL